MGSLLNDIYRFPGEITLLRSNGWMKSVLFFFSYLLSLSSSFFSFYCSRFSHLFLLLPLDNRYAQSYLVYSICLRQTIFANETGIPKNLGDFCQVFYLYWRLINVNYTILWQTTAHGQNHTDTILNARLIAFNCNNGRSCWSLYVVYGIILYRFIKSKHFLS